MKTNCQKETHDSCKYFLLVQPKDSSWRIATKTVEIKTRRSGSKFEKVTVEPIVKSGCSPSICPGDERAAINNRLGRKSWVCKNSAEEWAKDPKTGEWVDAGIIVTCSHHSKKKDKKGKKEKKEVERETVV